MDESDYREVADASPDLSRDLNALIASLRTAGVDRFDPVRLHYIDALARRAATHRGSVRRMLDAKLAKALATLKERFEQAQCDARQAVARNSQQYPDAASDLQQLLAAGDFNGLRQCIGSLKTREQCASLSALVHQLEQHSPETGYPFVGARRGMNAAAPAAHTGVQAGNRAELKTIRKFRNIWSKLSADKQVAQALEQAPTNAGPINSHMLVLRSLAMMRDISPDYLNRFISYADTLLCLDQGEKEKPVMPKKQKAVKAAKK